MRRFVTAVIALLVLGGAGAVSAEPRFAVREGMRCSDCHINRTGGGMRTPFGVSFSQTNLSTFRLNGVYDPRAGDSIAFGANLRLANRTVFVAKTSLEDVDRRSAFSNSFDIREGNLYFRADAIPGHLTVYFDETVTPESASSREAFALVQGGPLGSYAKVGRFLLPYGLRIPDDFAFIRQQTGFTYANADLGAEVGLSMRPFELMVAVTNGSLGGNDPNEAKQVTAQASFVSSFVRAGASFAWNDTSTQDFDFYSLTSGGHIGGRLGRLLLLTEVDWIRSVSGTDSSDQLALYVEGDYEAVKGLYVRTVFEAFDPLYSLDNNERDRFVFGLSWFPMQLLELRAEYRLNRDIPQRVNTNADELIVEMHGFL